MLNEKGERFVDQLLPRDVVTKAIKDEMETNAKFVYLSMEHMGADVIKKRFPNIYEYCLAQGYDITKGTRSGYACSALFYGWYSGRFKQ